ncbi:MAG: glycosyltransferase family 2 protein [Firmicutes bacterium]|jgi:cellulose synthase/poly-beta-1,6-N-acetylglucosamine synthase-like glycosyltransferase|nr:glycosyltransferase family 2 protein [Bacillota bacterium]
MFAMRVVFMVFTVLTLGLMGFSGNWRSRWQWVLVVVFGALAIEAGPVSHFVSVNNLHLVDGMILFLFIVAGTLYSALKAANVKAGKTLNIINQLVDQQALADFNREYPGAVMQPVTVVIPAYYEVENIGRVLDSIPRVVDDTPVTVLVVVDGSPDGTDRVVREHGDFVSYISVNRGQGAALRVGYRLAIDHGAQYIVTLDADGQYDPSEMYGLVKPVLRDEADYVQGSRRMGRYVTDDVIRVMGVYWFNWLIGLLLRQRITDSSNGFRAIKAGVLKNLALSEDQYHAAELLILAVRKRYRVIERPASMYPRNSGETKKGHNLLYAYHYARVIFKSWLRAI